MPDNNNGLCEIGVWKKERSSPDSWSHDPSSNSNNNGARKDKKMSKAKCKWLRRMTLEVNKFPYSNSKSLGLYSFDSCEMEWYYKETRLLADKVLDIFECPLCEDTIKKVALNSVSKKAVMPGCGCTNPLVCCTNCWLEAGSSCLSCKKATTSHPFEPVDEIIQECHLFLKEKAFKGTMRVKESDLKRISESYFQFLKRSELQLMCNYCFGTLENTIVVNFGNGTLSQVCTGCHELYMECYTSCTNFFPFPTFDRLNHEFLLFFSKVLAYCSQKKIQTYKDPYVGIKQPSHFRREVMKRKGFKRKFVGIFKKAVVVAACAYLVTYFVR